MRQIGAERLALGAPRRAAGAAQRGARGPLGRGEPCREPCKAVEARELRRRDARAIPREQLARANVGHLGPEHPLDEARVTIPRGLAQPAVPLLVAQREVKAALQQPAAHRHIARGRRPVDGATSPAVKRVAVHAHAQRPVCGADMRAEDGPVEGVHAVLGRGVYVGPARCEQRARVLFAVARRPVQRRAPRAIGRVDDRARRQERLARAQLARSRGPAQRR